MKESVGELPEKQLGNRKSASLTDFVNIHSLYTICYFIDILHTPEGRFHYSDPFLPLSIKKKTEKRWVHNT